MRDMRKRDRDDLLWGTLVVLLCLGLLFLPDHPSASNLVGQSVGHVERATGVLSP